MRNFSFHVANFSVSVLDSERIGCAAAQFTPSK
ncbi:unnamed protein product [Chondrus crispus]|uniref:Uncharacterized protein n=1 Tax=Chondrus crispus TaxID=2769 RepID=R7QAT2_CHOCR|nr:unnamed protein product [Chondrus crispus]CDF35622.1 unnamed protein product [Chondrus crispus]|eukprot:XP_005715441.1 unnamed protein product [Chondrus crispus]